MALGKTEFHRYPARPCCQIIERGTPLPALDIWRARRFYEEVLGFEPVGPQSDGTFFFVHPSDFAGSNQATGLAFMVPDIEAEMAELRQRGVRFEEYDLPGFRTVEGVATWPPNGTKMAWFKDTEGNLIGLGQPPT